MIESNLIKPQQKQFFCQQHQQEAFELYIDPDQPEFVCFECKQNQNKYHQKYIVTLNEILGYEQNNQNIISNFPPLIEEDFYLKYNIDENSRHNLSKYGIKLVQIMDDINNYFEGLKSEISKEIDKANLQAQQKFKSIQRKYQKIFQVYENISRIDTFKEILISYDSQNQNDLKTFVNQYFQNSAANSEALLKKIKKFEQLFGQIEFSQPREVKNLINLSIQQIDFFNSLNTNDNSEQLVQGQNQNTSQKHSQDIYNLISNQTNCCNQQFLDQFRNFTQKYEFLFENFPFDQKKYNETKRNRYIAFHGNLNGYQFQKLTDLSEEIQEVNQFLKSCCYAKLSQYVSQQKASSFCDQIINKLNIKKILLIFMKLDKRQIKILSYVNFQNAFQKGEPCNLQIQKSINSIKIRKINNKISEYAFLNLLKSIHYQFRFRVYNSSTKNQNQIILFQNSNNKLTTVHAFQLDQQSIQQANQHIDGKTYSIQDLSIEIDLEKCFYQITDESNTSVLYSQQQIPLNFDYTLSFRLSDLNDFIEIKHVFAKL
ncbi:hypothetical protein ABPG74_007583 [Tetrahymena malaccensis]